MGENGHYDGQFEDMLRLLRDIDQRTETQLDDGRAAKGLLEQIAANTGAMAKHFQAENIELTRIVVKEKRVPFLLVLVGVIVCGTYILADKLEESDLGFEISAQGLKLTHGGK